MSWLGSSHAGPSSPSYSPGVRLRRDHRNTHTANSSMPTENDEIVNARPGRRRGHKLSSSRRTRSSSREPWTIGSKGWVKEGFRRFGEHCARNQIRTLLIDCLVMTNLFYPSFATYLEKRHRPSHYQKSHEEGTLAALRTPLIDSFFPYPPPLLPNIDWGPWWAGDPEPTSNAVWVAQPVHHDSVGGESIDLLRVAWADVGDVLDGDRKADPTWTSRDDMLVSLVHDLAETWEIDELATGARCVRHLIERGDGAVAEGKCYIFSPEAQHQASRKGITQLSSLRAIREGNTSSAVYRGIEAPFHVSEALRKAFEKRWAERLTEAVRKFDAEMFPEIYNGKVGDLGPWLISLAAVPESSTTEEVASSWPPRLVLFLYFVLFTTLLAQLSNASKVHSRFGLAFTGIVQLCCSTIMSFSVLALLGLNGWGWSEGQTVLPTYVLPFVIVVVGAENMSALTKAVFSVPFTYSVPVRIGIGLSKVGATIAITSLIDILLLGLVWLCVHLQPVREFCIFAAVVIVTDWFMLNTFFLTVLSIDAQRLELADVLASNGGLSTSEALRQEDEAKRKEKAATLSWRTVLRARTAKSGSLILFLTFFGVLYYYTEKGRSTFNTPASLYGYIPSATSTPSSLYSPSFSASLDLTVLTESEELWRSINPFGLASVRTTLPPSSIVIFPRPGHAMLPADIGKLSISTRRLLIPRLRPLFYFVKVIFVPQALSALALYILLLYLLKDADLLDAQRNRLGRGEEAQASDNDTDDASSPMRLGRPSLAAGVAVHMLPCSHNSDIDVIASSTDGRLALTVGVDNSVCLWRFSIDEQCSGTREMLRTDTIGAVDPIVAAAINRSGKFVAVATRRGMIQIWSIPDDGKIEALTQVLVGDNSRVTSIAFDESVAPMDDPFSASLRAPGLSCPPILAAFCTGAVYSVTNESTTVVVSPVDEKSPPYRVTLLDTEDGGLAIISTLMGSVLWRKTRGSWCHTPLASSDTLDRVLTVAHSYVEWHDRTTEIIAVGHRSGRVEVYDSTGEPVIVLGQTGDPVRCIKIANPPTTRCTTCDHHSTEGFFIISSTATRVYIDRILPRAAALCRCTLTRRASALDETLGLSHGGTSTSARASPIVLPPSPARTRVSLGNGNSFGFGLSASPRKSPGLVPPPSNGEFPLSSHGSRRLSGWQREQSLSDDGSHRRPPSPLDRQATLGTLTMSATPAQSSTETWEDVEVVSLGAIIAIDGGWTVLNQALVGVRRAFTGIDDSQWQLWAVDLCAPWNGSFLIVDTASLEHLERRAKSNPRPTPRRSGGDNSSEAHLTPPNDDEGGLSIRSRRAERILSLDGRASFPTSVGSFSVPTHAPLGYVSVGPLIRAGTYTALGGFGNRLGVLTLRPFQHRIHRSSSALIIPAPQSGATVITTPGRQPHTHSLPQVPPPPLRRSLSGAGSSTVPVPAGKKAV